MRAAAEGGAGLVATVGMFYAAIRCWIDYTRSLRPKEVTANDGHQE